MREEEKKNEKCIYVYTEILEEWENGRRGNLVSVWKYDSADKPKYI